MPYDISFITPVYNVKPWLTECVESVRKQTGASWELILVDDGSTDGSGELCDRYAAEDERIRVIHQANAGGAAARNAALDVASGDWIAFVDSDDWIEPTYTETLRPYLNPNLDMIFFAFRKIRGTRKSDGYSFAKEPRPLNKDDLELMVQNLVDTGKRIGEVSAGAAYPWSKLYRRGFLEERRIRFNPACKVQQDVVLNLYACAYAENALFIPDALYNYRWVESSLTHRYVPNQPERVMTTMNAIGDFVASFRPQYRELYQKRILVCLTRICILDYCNRQNPNPYRERKAAFLRRRDSEPFRSALNVKTVRSFSFPKQACMWLLKFRLFGILNLLLRTGRF